MKIKGVSRWGFIALVGPLLALPLRAQQSFRSYQKLSGQVLARVGPAPIATAPQARNMPLRFQGWNHPERFGPEYVKRFTRPRESVRRGALLTAASRAAANFPFSAFPSAQFAPSALPGLLLRPSLPAGYIPTAVATADFNGDGNPDFMVANGGDNTLWLYFGKGDGLIGGKPCALGVKVFRSPDGPIPRSPDLPIRPPPFPIHRK